jgi:hypothetical protein
MNFIGIINYNAFSAAPSITNENTKMQCSITAIICFGNKPPGANVLKTFAAVIHKWAKKATVFVLGKLFQLSQMFMARARSLPRGASLIKVS